MNTKKLKRAYMQATFLPYWLFKGNGSAETLKRFRNGGYCSERMYRLILRLKLRVK